MLQYVTTYRIAYWAYSNIFFVIFCILSCIFSCIFCIWRQIAPGQFLQCSATQNLKALWVEALMWFAIHRRQALAMQQLLGQSSARTMDTELLSILNHRRAQGTSSSVVCHYSQLHTGTSSGCSSGWERDDTLWHAKRIIRVGLSWGFLWQKSEQWWWM